jgi:hypothetical protein
MVEEDLAEISTIRKMVLKHDLTTERDVATEVVPFLQTETKRLLKSLDSKSIVNRETRREHTTSSPYSRTPCSSDPFVPSRAQLALC